MTVLSDITIKQMVNRGELIIKPYEEKNVAGVSVDLRLGPGLLFPDYENMMHISLDEEIKYREDSSMIIPPNSFVLATTLEEFVLPTDICGSVEGRSSVGRRALDVQNAPHIGPGFQGNITLELHNKNPLPFPLKVGDSICQIIFYQIDKKVDIPYQGRYLGQRGTTGSRLRKR